MENKTLTWIKKNISNIIFGILILVLLFSSSAKEFIIKTVASTGLTTSSFVKSTKDDAINSFDVVDQNGKLINSKDLIGKVVFINFWASWCPPCRAEFPSMQEFYDQYKTKQDLVFLIINMDDDRNKGLAYLKKEKHNMPFYQLSSSISTDLYDGTLPTTVILDKSGKLRFHHTGAANFTRESFLQEIDLLLSE